MYSREERMKAIELYIKYDKCIADVVRELGYPGPNWYEAYLKNKRLGYCGIGIHDLRNIPWNRKQLQLRTILSMVAIYQER